MWRSVRHTAAVCGSACVAMRQCAAVCDSVRGCVQQCARQCAAVCGGARLSVWQCNSRLITQSRSSRQSIGIIIMPLYYSLICPCTRGSGTEPLISPIFIQTYQLYTSYSKYEPK